MRAQSAEENMNTPPKWWKVLELANHYELSPRAIYGEIADGNLVAHRFGRRRGALRIADSDRIDWQLRRKSVLSDSSIETLENELTQEKEPNERTA